MRKDIILDMDETLLHTFSKLDNDDVIDLVTDPHQDIADRVYACHVPDLDMRPGSGVNRLVAGIVRPGFDDFMRFCYEHFTSVIVWSAGTNNYVNRVLEEVCSEVGLPDVILTREDCVRVQERFEKPIAVLQDIMPSLGISLATTLIVDDREGSFFSNPDNGVLITPFAPDVDESEKTLAFRADDALLRLSTWLENEVLPCADVRNIEKQDF
jgi:TFIIF-interacting CTD phosphatase-like protein